MIGKWKITIRSINDIYLAYNFKDFECALYIYIYIHIRNRKEKESPMFFGEKNRTNDYVRP